MGLININDIINRRPRKDSPRVNIASYKYNLIVGSSRQEVCLKAFCCALDISVKRIRRIRNLKIAGKNVDDQRGKHISYSLPDDTKMKVREYIESFPIKESHY